MTLNLPFFRQLAKALAKQFGDNCEVVLHDLTSILSIPLSLLKTDM